MIKATRILLTVWSILLTVCVWSIAAVFIYRNCCCAHAAWVLVGLQTQPKSRAHKLTKTGACFVPAAPEFWLNPQSKQTCDHDVDDHWLSKVRITLIFKMFFSQPQNNHDNISFKVIHAGLIEYMFGESAYIFLNTFFRARTTGMQQNTCFDFIFVIDHVNVNANVNATCKPIGSTFF